MSIEIARNIQVLHHEDMPTTDEKAVIVLTAVLHNALKELEEQGTCTPEGVEQLKLALKLALSHVKWIKHHQCE